MEDQVDRPGVVLDIQPVAYVLSPAVHGQEPVVPDVVYEQRDQFLWKLVGSVIVRAVGDDRGHPVGVVVSPHEMVRGSLAGRVGAVRGVSPRSFRSSTLWPPEAAKAFPSRWSRRT